MAARAGHLVALLHLCNWYFGEHYPIWQAGASTPDTKVLDSDDGDDYKFYAELDVGEEELANFGARAGDDLKRFVAGLERTERGALVRLRRIGGKGAKVRDVLSVLTGRSAEELRSVRIRKLSMRLGSPRRK